MEPKDKINITPDPSIKELVIRHGDAQPIILPLQLSASGTIGAPAAFFAVRTATEILKEKAIVLYSYEELFIKLSVDPTDKFAAVINGKLVKNPALQPFGINENHTFSTEELISLLKLNRLYFADREACMSIVTNLKKLKVSAQTEIEKTDDSRGNKKNLAEVKVTTEIPLDFTLKLPLFKGGKDVKFKVEVCFDLRDAALEFWLESVELAELLLGNRKELIDAELAKFDGYVKIEAQ